MKKTIIISSIVVCILVLLSLGIFRDTPEEITIEPVTTPITEPTPSYTDITTIGTSVEGREIQSYRFGTGDTHILFVGGIHGGYEWNSTLLAYELIDYLSENQTVVPDAVTVHVVPAANPDGLFAVLGTAGRFDMSDVPLTKNTTGQGRFNANGVDLNRNFACKWQPESTWRGNKVSAGISVFSEPESRAIRDLVYEIKPVAAVFFHSQANAVYASECTNGVLPETLTIMNLYASATGYTPVASFDAYPVTGDVEGWLASINIPALTVELKTHETVEWERNKPGIISLIDFYSTQ